MSQRSSGGSDSVAVRRKAAFTVADVLALAASPTFALMALMTGIMSDASTEMAGMSGHASPMSGMITMYLLMSAFHLTAWLKLARARSSRRRSSLVRIVS
jgi:hypothetical protein